MEDTGVKALPKNRFLRGTYLMIRRYLSHNVAIQSAALAFYLLFTIFPLLIFLSSLLGMLHLELSSFLKDAARFLPSSVLDLVRVYLSYVGKNPSFRLLWFGLFFSVYFPMRATNTLMRAVRTAYHLGPPRTAFRHLLKTLIYTALLIVTIVLTLTLLTVGRLALSYAITHFGMPVGAAALWVRLRFPVMALLMYFALYLLYAMTQDERQPQKNLYPGVLAALLGWMIASFLFSFYVENIAAYSILYGSIGTVIVLLMWLYLSAVFLIMGAELNGTLVSMRKEQKTEKLMD